MRTITAAVLSLSVAGGAARAGDPLPDLGRAEISRETATQGISAVELRGTHLLDLRFPMDQEIADNPNRIGMIKFEVNDESMRGIRFQNGAECAALPPGTLLEEVSLRDLELAGSWGDGEIPCDPDARGRRQPLELSDYLQLDKETQVDARFAGRLMNLLPPGTVVGVRWETEKRGEFVFFALEIGEMAEDRDAQGNLIPCYVLPLRVRELEKDNSL